MKKYSLKIDFRCPQGIYTWYKEFAELEGLSLSELLRKLPKMYDELEGMNEPFLIIKVGFEGIDKLAWLTGNPDDAIKEREKAIKREIAQANKDCKKTKVRRIFTDKEISDRFCIQKWNGKKFNCVCKDLGLKVHEEMFY